MVNYRARNVPRVRIYRLAKLLKSITKFYTDIASK